MAMLDAWEMIRAPRSTVSYNGNYMQKQKNKKKRRNFQSHPIPYENTNIPVEYNEDDGDDSG